jgi:hypothetical protein
MTVINNVKTALAGLKSDRQALKPTNLKRKDQAMSKEKLTPTQRIIKH